MSRVFLIVLDSVGCGGAPDAATHGDGGADTLGHIADACARGDGNRDGLRQGPLLLPHLSALGLIEACDGATGRRPPIGTGGRSLLPGAAAGFAIERSAGKDTVSGHWEIAGTPVPYAFGYFPDTQPSFPAELTDALIREAGLPGILGNCHASGTAIISDLGEEHVRTGKPICYTSIDSVLQIAAHEESFGLERLYEVCRIARRLVDPLRIGRTIARPFVGASAQTFVRTPRRKDFPIPPPDGTILDRAAAAGQPIVTVGKIGDIFAHRSTGTEVKAAGNLGLFDAMLPAVASLGDGGLLFANFVDFDTEFGHRRDVPGYAAALEAFDARLPDLMSQLRVGDLLVITADHGNDPTWRGTDHTREAVPVLCFAGGATPGPIGRRDSFADIGETVAAHLGLPAGASGRPWPTRG